jgi:hypothetical protein
MGADPEDVPHCERCGVRCAVCLHDATRARETQQLSLALQLLQEQCRCPQRPNSTANAWMIAMHQKECPIARVLELRGDDI